MSEKILLEGCRDDWSLNDHADVVRERLRESIRDKREVRAGEENGIDVGIAADEFTNRSSNRLLDLWPRGDPPLDLRHNRGSRDFSDHDIRTKIPAFAGVSA